VPAVDELDESRILLGLRTRVEIDRVVVALVVVVAPIPALPVVAVAVVIVVVIAVVAVGIAALAVLQLARLGALAAAATPSASATPSVTSTPTASPSASATPTPSPSFTASPSFTVSPTFSASPTAVPATPTPPPSWTCLADVQAVAVFPNPLRRCADGRVAVQLGCSADRLDFDLYSPAGGCVAHWSRADVDAAPGQWTQLPLPAGLDLENGLYFLKASAYRAESSDHASTRLLLLQ
jgi:hypothetical protein